MSPSLSRKIVYGELEAPPHRFSILRTAWNRTYRRIDRPERVGQKVRRESFSLRQAAAAEVVEGAGVEFEGEAAGVGVAGCVA
jgi:hypothetical protein